MATDFVFFCRIRVILQHGKKPPGLTSLEVRSRSLFSHMGACCSPLLGSDLSCANVDELVFVGPRLVSWLAGFFWGAWNPCPVRWGLFHKPWNKDPYLNNQSFMESDIFFLWRTWRVTLSFFDSKTPSLPSASKMNVLWYRDSWKLLAWQVFATFLGW